jgi:hypothetical protein
VSVLAEGEDITVFKFKDSFRDLMAPQLKY